MSIRLRKVKPFDEWRRRLIRETEEALLYGLAHPESAPKIPTIEVGRGSFNRSYAEHWWSDVLQLQNTNRP